MPDVEPGFEPGGRLSRMGKAQPCSATEPHTNGFSGRLEARPLRQARMPDATPVPGRSSTDMTSGALVHLDSDHQTANCFTAERCGDSFRACFENGLRAILLVVVVLVLDFSPVFEDGDDDENEDEQSTGIFQTRS